MLGLSLKIVEYICKFLMLALFATAIGYFTGNVKLEELPEPIKKRATAVYKAVAPKLGITVKEEPKSFRQRVMNLTKKEVIIALVIIIVMIYIYLKNSKGNNEIDWEPIEVNDENKHRETHHTNDKSKLLYNDSIDTNLRDKHQE